MPRKKIDDGIQTPPPLMGTTPLTLTERNVNQSADDAWSKLSKAVHMQLDSALCGQVELSPQAVIATLRFVEASREVAKSKQTSIDRLASLTLPVFDDDDDDDGNAASTNRARG